MSSSGVGPEQSPLERPFRVEEIERVRWEEEKKKKTRGEPPEKPPSDAWLLALLSLLLNKVIGYVKYAIKKGLASASAEPVRETLLLIKDSFEIMMQEDRCQDSLFLKNLSQLWQEALEHTIHLSPKSPWSKGMKTLIRDIESYPKNEEHTFGYYLDEYAGLKWLPLPYMEIIRELHRQYQRDPTSSLLGRWSGMIEEILNSD